MEDFGRKLHPFVTRNRIWALRLLQGYGLSLLIAGVMAALINSNEGDQWRTHSKGQKGTIHGQTALDECFWFTITTLHGIPFGEFTTKSITGDQLAMVMVAISYWCSIFMASIVVLSQLPGVKPRGLFQMLRQMISVVWPSYLIFVSCAFFFGFIVGPYAADGLSEDPSCKGSCEEKFNALGIKWLWHVMHRSPLTSVWPDTPFGRTVTVPAGVVSYLYPPYVLALIAIRRPTSEQHEELLAQIKANPAEAMGPGYLVPLSGPGEELMREF